MVGRYCHALTVAAAVATATVSVVSGHVGGGVNPDVAPKLFESVYVGIEAAEGV